MRLKNIEHIFEYEVYFDESYEIDQKVSIAGTKFKVIGSLKEKGTSFGFNSDNIILMPIDIGRKFIANRMNYEINVCLLYTSPSPRD